MERDILLRAADHLAEKLEVAEAYEQFKDVDFLKAPESKITDTDEWVYRSDSYVDMEKLEKTIIKKEWTYYSNNNQSFLQGEKNNGRQFLYCFLID